MPTGEPLSVLLVEDNPGDARLIQELLRDHPCLRLTCVETLAAARSHLAQGAGDLALLDLGLPDSQGLDTVGRVVQDRPALPVIVLTGRDDDALARAALTAGAQDYLVKDAIEPGMLVRSIMYACERKRAELALRASERRAQEQAERLQAVQAVSAEITRELDLGVLLDRIIHRAADLVGAASGAIWLWDETESLLVPRAWRGLGEWLKEFRRQPGEGIPGTIAERRAGLVVNDYRTSPYAYPAILANTDITAVVGEPLLYRDRLIGVLVINNAGTGRAFTEEHRRVLAPFATQAAIAIQNADLFAELKRSYLDLQKAQEELVRAQKLAALGQMAAGIAHELNNKLAVILGQVELLRLSRDLPAVQQGLDMLGGVVTQAAEVIRRLHDFARQRARSPLAPLDLTFVVEEALALTRPRWQEEPRRLGHRISLETALRELPPILGNAAEIQEALTHLILNAVDAMPEGGTLRLTAKRVDPPSGGSVDPAPPIHQPTIPPMARSDGWVELCVADTGIGMSEEVRQRAFDPFFTTKGVQRTGLGLSVVYGIMQRHGGRVTVLSTPGQGTRVCLRFRLAPREAVPPASPGPGLRPGRRILLVEDDASVRQTMAALLQAVGHAVLEAGGGAEGLARFAQDPVDLVLTDLGMPGMTGWEVARTVKAQNPSVPVVLLTGWGETEDEPGDAAGAVDRILGKPVSLKELLQVITDLTGPPPD